MPRRTAYRALGRVPCVVCGEPASEQWRLRPCVIGRELWYALCAAHDVELNEHLVRFLRVPDGEALIQNYRERMNMPLTASERARAVAIIADQLSATRFEPVLEGMDTLREALDKRLPDYSIRIERRNEHGVVVRASRDGTTVRVSVDVEERDDIDDGA